VQLYGLDLDIPNQIYFPAEDTDLCINWLQEWVDHAPSISYILEIGCGPGTCSLYIQQALSRVGKNGYVIAIDINPLATLITKKNAILNKIDSNLQLIHSNLASALRYHQSPNLKFDLIFFNPPYLPAEEEIINRSNRQSIDDAWEGGSVGDEIILTFLNQIPHLLDVNGDLMFITSSLVDQSNINRKLKDIAFNIVETTKTHIFFEDILLIHAKHKSSIN
jgi:release factor glutamine methyltransferase